MRKITSIGCSLLIMLLSCSLSIHAQDNLTKLLQKELTQQMEELSTKEFPPYHMNYRVVDEHQYYIESSFGAAKDKWERRSRIFVPQIRIGSPDFDNFKNRDIGSARSLIKGPSYALLPLDDEYNEKAFRQAVWDEVNNRYRFAVDVYHTALAERNINVADADTAPNFSPAPVERYYEEPLPNERQSVDMDYWGERMNELSELFKSYPEILGGESTFRYTVKRIYFVDTDGRTVVQNLTYSRIMVHGVTKAEDGMKLPLTLSYFSHTPEGLPTNGVIIKDIEIMVDKLLALREAPIVDPFTGPALLSGAASGVFFHEIFGHRVEGQRMKSEKDAQTFKNMIGEYVLPPDLQVYADPSLKNYAGEDMNGYYLFDDQGVRGQRVDIVVDGKLNDFLMTRTPLDGHPKSNGHARCAAMGYDPVSRQSNLIVESSNPKTEEELRQLLIKEIKEQGKPCGYYFKAVTGGFTLTNRKSANAFNVTPLEVYEIYADGRPDKLVRGVDLIGTPLSMFSNIIYAGGVPEIFTGTCGAESGSVPVTATSPTILVKKVEMQRKAKAQELPPILDAPNEK